MKHIFLGTMLVLLVSCVPSQTSFKSEDGARLFALKTQDQIIKSEGNTFTYKTSEYQIGFQLQQWYIPFELVNISTDKVIRILWDDCAIVRADGSGSRVVKKSTSWNDRNNPQTPSVIPSQSKISDGFFPTEGSTFNTYSGWDFVRMFEYPIKSTTNIRLLLVLDVDGQRVTQEFVFAAQPQS
jgi:hypothetical protein